MQIYHPPSAPDQRRRFFGSWMMTDNADVIECVVFVLIEQFGGEAARFARDQAEIANGAPNTLCARTWREIADAIDRLEPERDRRSAAPFRAQITLSR